MARKPTTAETVSETPNVVIQEQTVEETRPLSAQTLAEMEAGRATLAAIAASSKAETEK